jgi:caffeoyl-CoA O-methyltransferase
MIDERIMIFDPETTRDLTLYVREWFAPEDTVLRTVRSNALAQGLPEIQIRPEEGQMLYFLARLIGARRILEIGTLAGYSGIWLARALPEDGKLITLEMDPRHARIAREHFQLAGVSDRVEIVEGHALNTLAGLAHDASFDLIFLDAEKTEYLDYLTWAVDHVRPGGLITAHNAFSNGQLLNSSTRGVVLRQFLETIATHDRLTGTIIPVGDGIAAALRR